MYLQRSRRTRVRPAAKLVTEGVGESNLVAACSALRRYAPRCASAKTDEVCLHRKVAAEVAHNAFHSAAVRVVMRERDMTCGDVKRTAVCISSSLMEESCTLRAPADAVLNAPNSVNTASPQHRKAHAHKCGANTGCVPSAETRTASVHQRDR